MKKAPFIILCLVILGLTDDLIGFMAPIDYSLEGFSVVPHFLLIGTLVYGYNKSWRTRLLTGMLAGLANDLLFAASFPLSFVFFGAAALLSGLAPSWSNSPRWSWTFFLLFALAADLIPFLYTSYTVSNWFNIFEWLYRMELFTILLDLAALWFIRYAADIMDRYYLLASIRQKSDERKRMQDLKAAGR